MDAKREAAILEAAIAHFGPERQVLKAIEELGELSIELARDLNGIGNLEAVHEEMADCIVMLNQLELIYGTVETVKTAKLERLAGMIYENI